MSTPIVTARLLVDAHFDGDGVLHETFLVRVGTGFGLVDSGGPVQAFPTTVLRAVMQRYGRALGDDVDIASAPRLTVDEDHQLAVLRYHTPVDATGRDWMLWLTPTEPPLAAIATQVVAALRHLLRGQAITTPR